MKEDIDTAVVEFMKMADKNKDGKLSLKEYLDFMDTMLSALEKGLKM